MRITNLLLATSITMFVSIAAASAMPANTSLDSATAAAPAAVPAQPADVDPDKVVCHMGPAPTGSRLGSTRECHTQREWDRMRQEQANMVQGHQTVLGCGPSGCGH